MDFKVGDKVKLKRHCATGGFHIGDICTITGTNQGGYYNLRIKKDNIIGYVDEDSIELVPFTKRDLKNGDIVTLRNGDKLVVIDDTDFTDLSCDNDNGVANFDDLTNDLKFDYGNDEDEYDIIKVERPIEYATVYKRTEEDKKEMTIAEIEKELGYSIKIVKEDK